MLLIAISQLNYGFDNQVHRDAPSAPAACRPDVSAHTIIQAFAQTQAMNAFDEQFGDYDPATDTYAIPTQWLSLMNGLPFVGFAVGTNDFDCL